MYGSTLRISGLATSGIKIFAVRPEPVEGINQRLLKGQGAKTYLAFAVWRAEKNRHHFFRTENTD